MPDLREQYNRCGSCQHFDAGPVDSKGRAFGICNGKPTRPEVVSTDFGCPEYWLDRDCLMFGAIVPDDADLSPAERRKKALAVQPPLSIQRDASTQRHRHTGNRPREPERQPPKPKIREIPIDGGDAMQRDELKAILQEVLAEALGLSDAPLHPRFQGGKVIVKPANAELAPKEIEIDALFKKIVSVRDKLRVLEQKINASELPASDKVQIQQYITGCYGSLTTFNFLFRDREDWFVGQGEK
jgi:hypothetical protein